LKLVYFVTFVKIKVTLGYLKIESKGLQRVYGLCPYSTMFHGNSIVNGLIYGHF